MRVLKRYTSVLTLRKIFCKHSVEQILSLEWENLWYMQYKGRVYLVVAIFLNKLSASVHSKVENHESNLFLLACPFVESRTADCGPPRCLSTMVRI